MAIPDHVKQQAMSAVSNRETTAMMRSIQGNGQSVSEGTVFSQRSVEEPKGEIQPLSNDAKRQAMSAISHPETAAQIRLVENGEGITPPWTPSHGTHEIAEKIARMHKSGQDLGSLHNTITQDDFGREHG